MLRKEWKEPRPLGPTTLMLTLLKMTPPHHRTLTMAALVMWRTCESCVHMLTCTPACKCSLVVQVCGCGNCHQQCLAPGIPVVGTAVL